MYPTGLKRKSNWLDGFFGQFLRESTIHGVKYIGLKDRHFSERVIWLIAVLAGLALSLYMVEEQYKKYFENPVIISFQPKQTAVAQIPFPAITICNINILKRSIMMEIAEKLEDTDRLQQDENAVKEAVTLSEHLSHYCLAASSFRRVMEVPLEDSSGTQDFVENIHNFLVSMKNNDSLEYNETSKAFRKTIAGFKRRGMHNCDDMILKCVWARGEVDCRKIFSPIYTQHGSCCVFNMMPKFILRNMAGNDTHAEREKKRLSNDTTTAWQKFDADRLIRSEEESVTIKHPKHQKAGGRPYGLSILINLELNTYGTCNSNDGYGFKVIAHSPISFPNIADYGILAPVDNEVFINVHPELTTASEEAISGVNVRKRSCYFPSDSASKLQSYKFYSADNCMDECIARVTYEACDCVRYFMPKNQSQRLCGASKLKCAEDVRKNLTSAGRSSHCSICRPACTEIKYKMQVSQFPLRNSDMPFEYQYNASSESKNATKPSILHIFICTDSVYAKERKKLYDASDLLANVGGLFGLTLGCSIISIVEILYFFTLRAWFQHRSDKEEDEDDDFYSRSTARKAPKLSAIVRPRIVDTVHMSNPKAIGYYNWAVKTTNTITKVDVSSIAVATSFPKTGTRRRGATEFDLLSGSTNGKSFYPYLS